MNKQEIKEKLEQIRAAKAGRTTNQKAQAPSKITAKKNNTKPTQRTTHSRSGNS